MSKKKIALWLLLGYAIGSFLPLQTFTGAFRKKAA